MTKQTIGNLSVKEANDRSQTDGVNGSTAGLVVPPLQVQETKLKTTAKKDRAQTKTVELESNPQLRLLPPLVSIQSTTDRCCELVVDILTSVVPQARAGRPSAISIRELEEGVEVSTIALCWHLAVLADPIRRAKLTDSLIDETCGLVVSIEAAAITIKKGISVDEALEEMAKSVGLRGCRTAA